MRAIAASWVITGDPDAAPIADGALVLDDAERILAVGARAELGARFPQLRFSSRAAVLLPGLCNAHTHLELSALRGRVPGGRGFGPWVAAMLAERERTAPEQDHEAIEAGVSELLAAGTAAVGEVSNTLGTLDALASAPLLGRVFHEVFGLRREAAEAMLARAEQARSARADFPRNLSYALAPHTLFTLHPAVAAELLRKVRAAGRRTSLHLCEHGAERAFLSHGGGPFAEFLASRGAAPADFTPPGTDPVRYARTLGALGPDVLCVHFTDAREDEIAIVAEAGAKVVLCPRSNLHIEVTLPPLLALLRAGLRPALGTDSLASSPSLDVLLEARALAERFTSVPARTLLAMATCFGAEALGLEADLGTLAVGKRPGVIAFAHDGVVPPADPERFLLSRAAKEREVLARPAAALSEAEEAA